jgi:hypothetical protein
MLNILSDDYTTEQVAARLLLCEQIVARARTRGLDATVAKVNRNYLWWLRWYTGAISTGYLIRATGVKGIQHAR